MAGNLVMREAVDVVVCGGGSAGFAAAVTAARAGASTVLIEASGALGGIWTQAFLSGASDWRRKTALMREFETCWEQVAGRPVERDPWGETYPWVAESFFSSPEYLKVVMERMVAAAGVKLRLYTQLCGVRMQAGVRGIEAVETVSKSGREMWPAAVFVDATGDGDLGALAGCGFALGREENGQTQPMSMAGLVTGLREEDVLLPGSDSPRRRVADELAAAGCELSVTGPGLTRFGPGLFKLNVHHAYGMVGLDAEDLTRATVEGRAETAAAVLALRSRGGIWKDIELAATAPSVGVRDGRRLRGLYQVTCEDLIAGRRHEDAVCRVTFPVDVHSTDPAMHKGFSNEGVAMQPYDIPLRALIAADVDNLAMAGRCISGDFIAHASYRVVGNCMATGAAAGAVCARAAADGVPPASVPFAAIQEKIGPVV